MSRDLSAGWIVESIAKTCRPCKFFEGVFRSQTLRLWSGVGSISWNSQIWQGNGWLREIEGIEETEEIEQQGMKIVLAGVPAAVISLALSEGRQGASGKVWEGFLNAAGAVISTPYLAAEGKFDYCYIKEDIAGALVEIQYETHLLDMERPKEFRYNSRSQQIFFPTDRGFEYVDFLADKKREGAEWLD